MIDYKGLRATLERMVVSDDMVSAHISRMMTQNPRIVPVTDRPSQPGDELVLDYAGFCDGVQFEGGTAQAQTLTLGSGAFIPGFEEQLVGKAAGDDVDVRVTFPAQYHAPNLAGKDATFKCRIHEIRLRRPYDDGDAFARDVCGLEDMAALRQRVLQGLQDYADHQAEEELKLQLLDRVAAEFDGDVSPEALNAAVQQQLDALEAQLSQKGLTLEAYCQFTGKSVEQLREDCAPDARRGIARQRALDAIAREEHLEADEASMGEAIQEICRQNRVSIEQLLPHIDENARRAIAQNVINQKALDCLRAFAVVEVVEKR